MHKTLHNKQQEYQSIVHLTVPSIKKPNPCFACQKELRAAIYQTNHDYQRK